MDPYRSPDINPLWQFPFSFPFLRSKGQAKPPVSDRGRCRLTRVVQLNEAQRDGAATIPKGIGRLTGLLLRKTN